jgi:hypothetical protein
MLFKLCLKSSLLLFGGASDDDLTVFLGSVQGLVPVVSRIAPEDAIDNEIGN